MLVHRLELKPWIAIGALVLVGRAPTTDLFARPFLGPEPSGPTAAKPKAEPALRPDVYGDPLPAGAVARLGTVRLRHDGPVWCLAFSPDGKRLASSGNDKTVRLWDAETGLQIHCFAGEHSWAKSVAVSPDSKIVASGHYDRIRFWDVATAREVALLLKPAPGPNVAFAPDGKMLATGHAGLLRRWELPAGNELSQVETTAYIETLAYSPDGKTIALGSRDRTVRLIDAVTGKEIKQLRGHKADITSLAFAPDGKLLATGSRDMTIHLWELPDGKLLRKWVAHEFWVESVAFAPDGKALVSAGRDGIVQMWDPSTGQPMRHFAGHMGPVTAAVFAPNGKSLATGGMDGTVRIWDVESAKERPHRIGDIDQLGFLPDGKSLVSTGSGQLRTWEAMTGKEIRQTSLGQGQGVSLAVGPDGQTVATGNLDGSIRLWDATTGKELHACKGHSSAVNAIVFASDGKTFVSGGTDATIRLWDTATGNEIAQFSGHRAPVKAIALSSDGRSLASTAGALTMDDRAIYLWDVAARKERRRIATESWVVANMAFSPDSQTLAGVGWTVSEKVPAGEIRLWEVGTGKETRKIESQGEHVAYVAFAPDGRTLASGSLENSLRLWEVLTGKERRQFQGNQRKMTSLVYSRNGEFLASGGETTALIWAIPARLHGQAGEPLAAGKLENLWTDLGSQDASKAYSAIRALSVTGQFVDFARQRLNATSAVDRDKVAQLIGNLDSDEFAVRQRASKELAELGEGAEPALRKALESQPSAEARRRIGDLLKKRETVAVSVSFQALRAVEVLEQIGSTEAKELLATLAKGMPGSPLTKEATGALERLRK